MTEERPFNKWFKKFIDEFSIKLAVATALAGLGTLWLLLWKFAPSVWKKAFAPSISIPVWCLCLLGVGIGFAFFGLYKWGHMHKVQKEFDRIRDVPVELLDDIIKKGMHQDLLNGEIRVRDGKVYYGDLFRRHELVPEFGRDKSLEGLQIGMNVTLVSGGPQMTILSIGGADRILCCWMDEEKKEHRQMYPASALMQAPIERLSDDQLHKMAGAPQKRLTRRTAILGGGWVSNWKKS
jgi:uncharacterized protein YodC (DUF2158 family)